MERLPFNMPAVLRKIHTALTGGTFSPRTSVSDIHHLSVTCRQAFTEDAWRSEMYNSTVDLHWK